MPFVLCTASTVKTTNQLPVNCFELATMFRTLKWHFWHLCLSCLLRSVTTINVTIMVYGAWPPFLLQSIPFLGPGIDTAISQVGQNAADLFNISRVYVASSNVKGCTDTGTYYTDVVDFYYRKQGMPSSDEIIVLFYAGCDGDPTLALLAAEWDIFVASIGTSFSNFRNRDLFPTTINAGPLQYNLYGTAVLGLCEMYNWTNVAFVYQLAGIYPFGALVYGQIVAYIRKHTTNIRIIPVTIQDSTDFKHVDYDAVFDTITQSCRVVLISTAPTLTREIMIQAHRRKLTSGSDYAWFDIALAENALGPLKWQLNDPDDNTARSAFVSLFRIIGCWEPKSAEMDSLRNHWMKQIALDFNSTGQPNQYTESAFGLVHVLVQGIRNASALGLDVTSGRILARQISGTSTGIPAMSDLYRIDDNGERENRICIDSFSLDSGHFEKALYVDVLGGPVIAFPDLSLVWRTFDGLPPKNVPVCGYLGHDPICKRFGLGTLAGILVGVLTVLGILVGLCIWRINATAAAGKTWWKIDPHDLQRELDAQGQQHAGLCSFHGCPVWTKTVSASSSHSHHDSSFPNGDALNILKQIRRMNDHVNIVRLIGIAVKHRQVTFVTEYCRRGCLTNIIGDVRKDTELRGFVIADLIEGLYAIHNSPLKRHGNLKPSTCLIDGHFTVKIAQVGMNDLISTFAQSSENEEPKSVFEEIIMAPELANSKGGTAMLSATSATDIFALGWIVEWLFSDSVWAEQHDLDVHTKTRLSLRPDQTSATTFVEFAKRIQRCRSTNPADRPSIAEIRVALHRHFGGSSKGLVITLLKRLERNAKVLESAVAKRTEELKSEVLQCDNLLREILPKYPAIEYLFCRRVVIDMRTKGAVVPESFEAVTVMFTYVIGFGDFVTEHEKSSLVVIDFLNQMFVAFDQVLLVQDVYKVETINDSYMVASGVPDRNGDQHASEVCFTAIGFLHTFNRCWSSLPLAIKFGINSGPCVTGVIGKKRPRYCLFGDTVNTASRLASHGEAWKIHIGALTRSLIRNIMKTEFRGQVNLKGKGQVNTYWLLCDVQAKENRGTPFYPL